jgi:hypothetical protein
VNYRVRTAFIQQAITAIARPISPRSSRRAVSGALIGVPLAGLLQDVLGIEDVAASKQRNRRKQRRRKERRRNENRASSSCTPTCTGRTCGDDGCGGSCGTCASPATCRNGVCGCPSGQFECQGRCIPTSECCTEANCGTGQVCLQGQCVTWRGTCQAGEDICTDLTHTCAGGDCLCVTSMSNQTRCAHPGGLADFFTCDECNSDADCAELYPGVLGAFCIQDTGSACPCSGACYAPCPS